MLLNQKVTYINDNIQGNYDDNYYQCNYGVFSDEKIAEINAIKDLILFIKNNWFRIVRTIHTKIK